MIFLTNHGITSCTVCGHVHETCHFFPGTEKVVHAGFDYPPALAKGESTGEGAMFHFLRVRDEIRPLVEFLIESLQK